MFCGPGKQLSDGPGLEEVYYDNPDASDLSEYMVGANTVSGHRDVVGPHNGRICQIPDGLC